MSNKLFADGRLIIVSPNSKSVINRFLKQNGWSWCYIGENVDLTSQLILTTEKKLHYEKEFQKITVQEKQSFIDWVAELGKQQNQNIWHTTFTAYKSPFSCDLYEYFCKLKLIESWIEKKIINVVIIIDDPWLLYICLINFKKNDAVRVIPNYVKRFLENIKLIVGYQINYFVSVVRIILDLTKFKRNSFYSKKTDFLIYTWVMEYQFQNSSFYDLYLGRLADHYKDAGFDVSYAAFGFYSLKYRDLMNSNNCFIDIYDFLDLKIILKSILNSCFFRIKSEDLAFKGLNVSDIIKKQSIIEKSAVFQHYLFYLSNKKLLSGFNINKGIIYPFENQPWDKMMVRAAREIGINGKLAAHNHGDIAYLQINYCLSAFEDNDYPLPDIIFSNTSFHEFFLKTSGFMCPVINGGTVSLRYNISKYKKDRNTIHNSDKNNILVLLPYGEMIALNLINYIVRQNQDQYQFLIKPHPTSDLNKIKELCPVFPNNFTFIEGSLKDWIQKISYAIYFSTSAGLECLVNGVDVIKYLPALIDMDCMFMRIDNIKTVSDGDELDWKSIDMSKEREQALKMFGSEPIKYSVWDDFFNISLKK